MDGDDRLVGGWFREGERLEGLSKREEARRGYEAVVRLDKVWGKEAEKRIKWLDKKRFLSFGKEGDRS